MNLDNQILVGDVLDRLAEIPAGAVDCCVTSPPYFGLRDYGTARWEGGNDPSCDHKGRNARKDHVRTVDLDTRGEQAHAANSATPYKSTCGRCGAVRVDQQIGLESTPDEYVARMVEVFREVRRVLAPDGTLWLNLGDTYQGSGTYGGSARKSPGRARDEGHIDAGLPPKNLLGIPWRVAFALQADGWWLRQDIIWCLSGGTKVYARTQKGEAPTAIKDLVRLDPATVQLWNGERWTQVLGWSESDRGDPLEIELRSGERIGCTEGHTWPTNRGNVRAADLQVGDVIRSTTLPEPSDSFEPSHIGCDVAWMLGLYLAEGSQDSRGRIQLAGHIDQTPDRLARLTPTVRAFGGTLSAYSSGESGTITVKCPALTAIVDQYVHGRSAKTKGIRVRAWRHTNEWLAAFANGYLLGDGHWDATNNRWRLGFTRNDRLADDMRTLCARLGWTLTLKPTMADGFGETWPVYRGEIRRSRSGHHNERDRGDVVAVRRSRARKFWDIGVADEPHTFALASGVLTHNSKPNPMPESVRDRCTKAHDYVFRFSRGCSPNKYVFLLSRAASYRYDADAIREPHAAKTLASFGADSKARAYGRQDSQDARGAVASGNMGAGGKRRQIDPRGANARSVWTITPRPYPGAHFATFPVELPERCILAGCREGGLVLDPFFGTGTTGLAAVKNGRRFLGIELNPEYAEQARERLGMNTPMFPVEAR